MSYLLPQFKCCPDNFAVSFKGQTTHSSIHSTKNGESIALRAMGVLSSTATLLEMDHLDHLSFLRHISHSDTSSWRRIPASTSTAVLELEKLKLPSLDDDADSIPVSLSNHWITYIGAFPEVAHVEETLATKEIRIAETQKTEDATLIAAAAFDALTLAKAAVKLAKKAAMMARDENSKPSTDSLSELDNTISAKEGAIMARDEKGIIKSDSDNTFSSLPELDNKISATIQLAERVGLVESKILQIGQDDHLAPYPLADFDMDHTCEEEPECPPKHSSVVRSKRQQERKAKRNRSSDKSAANIVFVDSGSPSGQKRRQHSPLQDVDYSDPLRNLRKTTGAKLLTASEERLLSEGIQDLLKLERLQKELTERCESQPTYAQWAAAAGVDQKTLKKRVNHGIVCKNIMIKSNIRLVISIAKNYQGVGLQLQDLIQEGCRGLIRGSEKFDATKGFKFSTYAHWWIKQAVRKSLSDQSRTIRLPFHMVEATYKVKEATRQLQSENGRQPLNEEIAEVTGLSMKRLSAVLMIPKAPKSLDQKIGINDYLRPSDVIADPRAETSEDRLMKQCMKEDLEKVLDTLNPREKQVVKWRFGLEESRMKTLLEIGDLLGLSRERVRQIESCALRKLKNKKRNQHLKQYIKP